MTRTTPSVQRREFYRAQRSGSTITLEKIARTGVDAFIGPIASAAKKKGEKNQPPIGTPMATDKRAAFSSVAIGVPIGG
jgi:hypothetical protein